MSNVFDSPQMAAGYAASRPPVHRHVIDRVGRRLQITTPVARALDVGCGAGLSTTPLTGLAGKVVGIDPSRAMLTLASANAPRTSFLNGTAERLPVRSQSIDLITAAGSLNWVDLTAFWVEVVRILTPRGVLVVYDFGAGREFRDSDRLSRWFDEFQRRYPSPPAREIDPATLTAGASGLRLRSHEAFEVGLTLSPAFYLDYVLTETNVAAAIRAGTPAGEIREWCRCGLASIFREPCEVVFRGYVAFIDVDGRAS